MAIKTSIKIYSVNIDLIKKEVIQPLFLYLTLQNANPIFTT